MTVQHLARSGGHAIAVRHRAARTGTAPTILFLPGYASDMMGSKALALDALAEREGWGMLRFDYRGTGKSEGRFADFTLEDWLEDAAAVAALTDAPDFTYWGYSAEDKQRLAAEGELRRDNPYGGEAELTTLPLWQSGERMGLLERSIGFERPVRLLHGDQDAEVPVEIAVRLKDALASTDVQLTIVKGGTHRLSAPHELALLERIVVDLAAGA
jgi:pimeloyl-ACP methyl ester carboxylesterase